MDIRPEVRYEMEMPASRRMALLAPYDVIVTVDGVSIIRLGRFSLALLANVRFMANKDAGCLLSIGSFCEAAPDAPIIVGGEHNNDALFNFTFSSHNEAFHPFIPRDDLPLAVVKPAEPTEIGDNVIISTNATILSGSRIGTGCVIGASAVVASKCEAYGVYVGVPARRLRDRLSPGRAALHHELRLPDVMAHHVPKLPKLLDRLDRGEIGIEEYKASVSFLPARPAVHFAGTRAANNAVQISKITGYSVGGQPVTDQKAHAALDEYFGQIQNNGKVQWSPDVFHAIGLY